MPVGPRLDRPSAVGDEGRARETSLAVATVVVLAFALVTGSLVDVLDSLRLLALGTGLVGAGVALFERETVSALFVGHLCFLPGGLVALVGVATTLLAPAAGLGTVLLVFGIAIALVGVAGGWANAVRDGSLKRAAKQGWGSFLVPIAVLVVAGVGTAGLVLWAALLEYALDPASPPGLSGLAFLVGTTALCLRVALPRIPLRQLAPRERRAAVAAAVDRWLLACRYGIALGFGGWVVLAALEVGGWLAGATALLPAPVALALASPLLRVPVLGVGLLALVLAALAWGVRRLAAGFGPTGATRLGPLFGGLALVGLPLPLLTFAIGRLRDEPGGAGEFVAALGLAFALVLAAALVFLLLFSLAPLLTHAGVLPPRAAGPAVQSAGLLVATLGLGLGGGPAPLVFAGAAAALVVWDVAEYGTGLTAELGHVPETRRLELLHGLLSVGVAVVAVVALVAASALVDVAAPAGPVVPAAVLAVVGVLVLLVPLRG